MKNIINLFLIYIYFIKHIVSQRIKSYYTSYKHGEKINIVSGAINSFKTQIPYDLYYLDICSPDEAILFPANLGEIILSGKPYETNYELNINKSEKCILLCSEKISRRSFHILSDLIEKDYFINYYLDNLPVGLSKSYKSKNKTINNEIRFDRGIPLGFIKNDTTYIYNYYKIIIELNKQIIYDEMNNEQIEYNIIGFYIEPFSIKINDTNKCSKKILTSEKQILKKNEEIYFYYDVNYIYTNTTYDERINKYYFSSNSIHWNSISIGLSIIIFLTIILTYIFFHSIKSVKEIENNRVMSDEEINEYGWRNISLDVFRSPSHGYLLASIFGTGIQLFFVVFYSLFFVSIGLLRPRNGGSYFALMVLMYIFLGVVSGYSSSRLYVMLHGRSWIKLTIITALLFPLIVILIFSIINYIYLKENSTTYVEFKDFYSLISIWILTAIPLLFIGVMIGSYSKKINFPCNINPIPGLILYESIPWYLKLRYAWILTGFPSFFSIFVELFYIMDSLWKQNIYALNKYLLSSLIVLIITSSEIGILFVYFNLCKGDYRWWWKSFFVGASPGVYIILFSIIYIFKMKLLHINSFIICLCFMFLLSIIIIFICGSLTLLFTFFFIKIIYSKINNN